jgi:hypothetical protein
MIWQAIRSKHAEAEDAARLRGLADADARKVAARAVRGDLRALMSELLTRAPVPAILDYLAVGSAWGEGGDRLIDQSDAVLQLVDAAYPQPTWTDLAPLEAKAADNDILWSTWIRGWADALRATLDMVRRSGFSEYFDPVTGEPLGAHNFSWTAALVLDLMRSHK